MLSESSGGMGQCTYCELRTCVSAPYRCSKASTCVMNWADCMFRCDAVDGRRLKRWAKSHPMDGMAMWPHRQPHISSSSPSRCVSCRYLTKSFSSSKSATSPSFRNAIATSHTHERPPKGSYLAFLRSISGASHSLTIKPENTTATHNKRKEAFTATTHRQDERGLEHQYVEQRPALPNSDHTLTL